MIPTPFAGLWFLVTVLTAVPDPDVRAEPDHQRAVGADHLNRLTNAVKLSLCWLSCYQASVTFAHRSLSAASGSWLSGWRLGEDSTVYQR